MENHPHGRFPFSTAEDFVLRHTRFVTASFAITALLSFIAALRLLKICRIIEFSGLAEMAFLQRYDVLILFMIVQHKPVWAFQYSASLL